MRLLWPKGGRGVSPWLGSDDEALVPGLPPEPYPAGPTEDDAYLTPLDGNEVPEEEALQAVSA